MVVANDLAPAELLERCERLEAELQMLRGSVNVGVLTGDSEARLRSILNRVENIPIQGYNAERRVIYWNHASTLVYGFSQAEALGRRLEDLIIPAAMRDAVVTAVDAWIAGGPAIPTAELVLCDKHGNDIPVLSSHIMHQTSDGAREMYCIDVDLRDLRRSERERARLVAEKTRLEMQYLESQKFEAIGRLAGGVAHDFNNLLQVINGYAALAAGDLPPDHPARPLVDQVLQAGERASALVGQLLTVSRRQVLDLQPLDLDLVIAEMFDQLRQAVGQAIDLRFRPQAQGGPIQADRTALERIVLNLCLNARDAMPGGGVLTLATEDVEFDAAACKKCAWAEPGAYLLLEVTDTGAGMTPELQERIFEPFFTTKATGKGTGLGLATVHSLVNQHGGLVRCESEPGRGSVFQVYLPV